MCDVLLRELLQNSRLPSVIQAEHKNTRFRVRALEFLSNDRRPMLQYFVRWSESIAIQCVLFFLLLVTAEDGKARAGPCAVCVVCLPGMAAWADTVVVKFEEFGRGAREARQPPHQTHAQGHTEGERRENVRGEGLNSVRLRTGHKHTHSTYRSFVVVGIERLKDERR